MSAFGHFQSVILDRAPKFLQRKNMARLIEAAAIVIDGAVQSAVDGFKLSDPLRGHASALPIISKDRQIPIHNTEPESSKRRRLAQWILLHRQRGSIQGQLRNLQPYFLGADGVGPIPRLRAIHTSRGEGLTTIHTLSPAGVYSKEQVGYQTWDYLPFADVAKWSAYHVLVDATDESGAPIAALTNEEEWDGDEEWDEDATWDGVDFGVAVDIVAMILWGKAAHSMLWSFILVNDVAAFDASLLAGATTDAEGWTSLPVAGNWKHVVYESGVDMGKNTRPPYLTWIYDAEYPTT